MSPRDDLLAIFRAVLDRVHAGHAVRRWLESSPACLDGPPWTLLAAGKAACAMAAGARDVLGPAICGGIVVTKDGHGFPVSGLDMIEAAHPVPDARSVAAAEAALGHARGVGPDGRLLVLLSGGASALWTAPAPGVSLADKQQVTDGLLRGGAPIDVLNAVRKHLSRIKGGGLLAGTRAAAVLTLAVSDVPGDVADTIGSGPTCPDSSSFQDALDAVDRLGLRAQLPDPVRAHLEAGAAGSLDETPGPGDLRFARATHQIVASLAEALEAACGEAKSRGLRVESLGASLRGEARHCARELAAETRRAAESGCDLLVVGGEPTVTVLGAGRGGRAQELALAFALEMHGGPPVTALFAGTDGTDGPTDAAGAVVDGGTLSRMIEAGLDPGAALRRNDSYPALRAAGDLLITGPTQTNVTDIGLILLRDRSTARPG